VIVAIDNHAQELGYHLGHAIMDIVGYALTGVVGAFGDLVLKLCGQEGGLSEAFEYMLFDRFDDKKEKGNFLDGIKSWFGGNDTKEAAEESGKEVAESTTDAIADELGSEESKDKVASASSSLLDYVPDELEGKLKSGMGLSADASVDEMINVWDSRQVDMKDANGKNATAAADGFEEQDEKERHRYELCAIKDTDAYLSAFNGPKGFDQHSPSKKMKQNAIYAKEGFEQGLNTGTTMSDLGSQQATDYLDAFSYASKAAERTVRDSALADLANTMANLGDVANLDTDFQPTITPVLDLSDVNSGFQSMNEMFASRRALALAGEASAWNNEGMRRRYEFQNENSSASYSGFGTLGTKLDALGEAILNRQIVLDSGEVVGGLAEPMDRALGIRAIRSQRTKGGR
jgi:hypothetical protein